MNKHRIIEYTQKNGTKILFLETRIYSSVYESSYSEIREQNENIFTCIDSELGYKTILSQKID